MIGTKYYKNFLNLSKFISDFFIILVYLPLGFLYSLPGSGRLTVNNTIAFIYLIGVWGEKHRYDP